MASSTLRAKKVPRIGNIRKPEVDEQEDASEKRAYECAERDKNPINFGLPRKSPRCAQCLKFKADDPSKAGMNISTIHVSLIKIHEGSNF